MNISKRLKNSDVFPLSWECSVFLFGRWVFNLGENQSSNKRKKTSTVIFNLLSFSHAIVPKAKAFWTFYVCISYEECIKLLKPLRPWRFCWFLAPKTKNISSIFRATFSFNLGLAPSPPYQDRTFLNLHAYL